MSDHDHDSHGQEDEHHEETWGDYNAEPPPPSTLPPIGPIAMTAFGLALTALMGSIMLFSLNVKKPSHAEHHDAAHPEHSTDHPKDHSKEHKKEHAKDHSHH